MRHKQLRVEQTAIERGRDEMNLAEFPLALLSQRTTSGDLSFTRERTLSLPDGGTLHQTWCVTGAPKYGLPQPMDEDVLLGLLKFAADNGFDSPRVNFQRSSLMALLRWNDAGHYYRRLEQALARLKTTSIRATNSFWNNRTKGYETHHFGVIESYRLFERSGGDESPFVALSANWAKFSDEFFSSIQAGYLKPLNLSLYFSLHSSISKRLYRYLDKKRYQKEKFSINLLQLATVHVGLSEKTCRYVSWIKKELDRAHAELKDHGFLADIEYATGKSGALKVVYTFNNRSPASEQLALPIPVDRNSQIVQTLVERGVSACTARELVRQGDADEVNAQIDVFDHLLRLSHGKALHNPAGFLVESIRNRWTLRPPGYVPPALREHRKQAEEQVRHTEAARRQNEAHEMQAIETVRASLSEGALQALRDEAFAQAREQIGNAYRLRRDSRVVDAFLNGILQERFLSGLVT